MKRFYTQKLVSIITFIDYFTISRWETGTAEELCQAASGGAWSHGETGRL
jgi:hypothetical protein